MERLIDPQLVVFNSKQDSTPDVLITAKCKRGAMDLPIHMLCSCVLVGMTDDRNELRLWGR